MTTPTSTGDPRWTVLTAQIAAITNPNDRDIAADCLMEAYLLGVETGVKRATVEPQTGQSQDPTRGTESTQEPEQAEEAAQDTPDPQDPTQALTADFAYTWLTAEDDSERTDALGDLLEGWYDAWPDTAVTSSHWPIAEALVRMLGPWEKADNNTSQPSKITDIAAVAGGIGSPRRAGGLDEVPESLVDAIATAGAQRTIHRLRHDLATAEQSINAHRAMTIEANGALRDQLLAALDIEDDGKTSLSVYVGRLIRSRDEAQFTAMNARHAQRINEAALSGKLHQAQAEAEQLRYERQLLGAARAFLDLVADIPDLPEKVAKRAERLAQRIVDEIGHPVTDESAMGPEYREQLATLTAELANVRADERVGAATRARLRQNLDDAAAELAEVCRQRDKAEHIADGLAEALDQAELEAKAHRTEIQHLGTELTRWKTHLSSSNARLRDRIARLVSIKPTQAEYGAATAAIVANWPHLADAGGIFAERVAISAVDAAWKLNGAPRAEDTEPATGGIIPPLGSVIPAVVVINPAGPNLSNQVGSLLSGMARRKRTGDR